MIGKRNGMLVVTKELPSELIHGVWHSFVEVKCDCGTVKKIRKSNFKANSRSCGCKWGNKEYHKQFAPPNNMELFLAHEKRVKDREAEISSILADIQNLDKLIHDKSTTLCEALKLRSQQRTLQTEMFDRIRYQSIMSSVW